MSNPRSQTIPLKIIIASFLLIVAGSYFHAFNNYELETLDYRFRLRPHIKTTDKVVLIEIGDDTIKKMGSWPFERNYHTMMVNALSEAGAKAIVFDIFFSEPSKYDDEFEAAIKEAGNVYMPFVLEMLAHREGGKAFARGYISKNLERFRKVVAGEGYINIIPDADGKYRRVPMTMEYNDVRYPYLSYVFTCDYIGKSGTGVKIPLDESSNMIINFSGKWGTGYEHYSYADILQSYLGPKVGSAPILDLSLFKDKVCIIGLTATGTVDLHPNPFETLYPAMGMHAEVFNSILTQQFITRMSREHNLVILIILTLILAFATLRLKPAKGLFILMAELSALIASAFILFNMRGIWIDLFYPVVVLITVYLLLTFHKYITEWQSRSVLENELDIARKIQASFLPKNVPASSDLEISAKMITASRVGGDIYDFIEFEKGHIGIMIGDVSGKGVPASLFMAMVAGAFKSFALSGDAPEKALSGLNEKLVKESQSGLFVTMFYAVIDPAKGAMIYGNGGHLPALYLPRSGDPKFLDTEEGTPLGLIEGDYSGGKIKFNKGDIIVFYTDGVTEAMNAKRQMFGSDRLLNVVQKNSNLSSEELVLAIEKSIKKFEPKSDQHDDITIIVVKVK